MSAAIDPVELARRLASCPSVTPATGEVFDVLEEALVGIGFEVCRFVAGEAPDGPVENLYASRGSGAPHFGFAGHLDVVPAGDGWSSERTIDVVLTDPHCDVCTAGDKTLLTERSAMTAKLVALIDGRIREVLYYDPDGREQSQRAKAVVLAANGELITSFYRENRAPVASDQIATRHGVGVGWVKRRPGWGDSGACRSSRRRPCWSRPATRCTGWQSTS